MDFLALLYQLIFMPLQIMFEVIYYLAFKLIGNPGVAIIALSFVFNLLVLPLYNRADAIQEEEREVEAKLSKGVEHIKKTFKGDEQLMMLQAYYRKNGYSPFDSLKGSLSLFLQIPFFVAAYQFLSNLEILNGASFGIIRDLSAPDGLLTIAGISVNVLPFVMTAVNLVSAYIFTKGLTGKAKIQLYAMAGFFLIFLYGSPSGLVVYWTLNNVFNLVKNIIGKLDSPAKGVDIVMGICGAVVIVYCCLFTQNFDARKVLYAVLFALLLNARIICRIITSRFASKKTIKIETPNKNMFILGALVLAILIGTLIPSAVIESSPREFVIIDYFDNPLSYVYNATAIALGVFVLWGGVFYWLTPDNCKVKLEKFVWFASGAAVVNYMFFNISFGVLSTTLHYEGRVRFSNSQNIINTLVIILLVLGLNFIWKKYRKYVSEVLIIGIIAFAGMAMVNVFSIQKALDSVDNHAVVTQDTKEYLSLSKNGKNIVIIMLDRAMGEYVPYIFNEKPELKDKFSGFTYYSNVISYGGHTIFGAPSIFGGYEYTPAEMNKRPNETLRQKHNEASKLMPEIFTKAGYNVVAGTAYTEDTTITDEKSAKEIVALNNRNFYFYGLFKSAPVVLQKFLYDKGDYLSGKVLNQEMSTLYTAFGVDKNFIKEYKTLDSLPEMSKINEQGNNFLMFVNKATHAPCLLQMPNYVPDSKVNNLEHFDKKNYTVNDRTLKMDTREQVSHYHANIAAMLKLGDWFDYMKNSGVYDNTRIILVSDHGAPLYHFDELLLKDGKDKVETLEWYYPLLLVKDFGSKEFVVSNEFMTNADVVTIATSNVVNSPKNPFTGKTITNQVKYQEVQYVFGSRAHTLNKHNDNTYLPGRWYSVHTNMWDRNNWKIAKEEAVLPY